MKTTIMQSSPLSGAVHITASVSHLHNEKIDASTVAHQLQESTQNKLYALSGSFNVIDSGPTRSLVQGFLVPAKSAIPFYPDMHGFRSLSSSIYSDDADNLWNLSRSAEGDFLVRVIQMEDPEEIRKMMAACSCEPTVGTDRAFFTAVASASEELFEIGDYAMYQIDGEIRFGYAAASVDDPEIENAIAIVNPAQGVLDVVDARQIVGSAEIGYQIPGHAFSIPEDMTFMASESSSVNDELVDYYQKIYGFDPVYWDKLSTILRNHRFM